MTGGTQGAGVPGGARGTGSGPLAQGSWASQGLLTFMGRMWTGNLSLLWSPRSVLQLLEQRTLTKPRIHSLTQPCSSPLWRPWAGSGGAILPASSSFLWLLDTLSPSESFP